MKDIPKIEIKGADKPETDVKVMFNNAFVDVKEKIRQQPVAITIGDSVYKAKRYPIPFGSYGDFSCIVGSSKAKKTFLKSAIVAGYIGGQSSNYFPNILGHDTTGKFVIDIDTEQSKYHSQRVFRRVCEMVGSYPEFYKTFSLREYSAAERLAFIDWIVTESEYKDKIGLISIDGYADLVSDFNSLEQSNNLQEKLLKWTTMANCHITGILHRNFNSQKPVGHVGSAVLKKAETVVFVEKDEELARVKCEYSRNIPFSEFGFRINEDWLPEEISM